MKIDANGLKITGDIWQLNILFYLFFLVFLGDFEDLTLPNP